MMAITRAPYRDVIFSWQQLVVQGKMAAHEDGSKQVNFSAKFILHKGNITQNRLVYTSGGTENKLL